MLRPILLLLALAAHLSTAAAAPRIVEICTAHGTYPLLEEAAPGEACEVCLAFCDLGAQTPGVAPATAPVLPSLAPVALPPGMGASAPSAPRARGPPTA